MFFVIFPLRTLSNNTVTFPNKSYTPKSELADDNGNYLTTQR